MKRVLLAATVLASAAAAQAADLPSRRSVPVAPAYTRPVSFSWTGFYIGGHAGASFSGSGNIVERNPGFGQYIYNYPGSTASLKDKTNFTGGLQAGYNFQMDRFVLGVEADGSYLAYKSQAAFVDPAGFVIGDSFGRKKADWTSTVRARAGVAIDRVLVYGTAGVAFTNLRSSFTDSCNIGGCGAYLGYGRAKNSMGWVVGLGAEYALTNNLSIKGEYLYSRFGAKSFNAAEFAVPPASTTPFRASSTDFHTVRLGLNYKFGL